MAQIAVKRVSSTRGNPPRLKPWRGHHEGGARMGIEVGGIFGLLVLIADVWAIISIAQSSASIGKKVLWIVLVLLLPVLGLILWFLLGPRGR
jgi:hypothetical protein